MESPRRVTLLIGRNGTVQLIPADDDDEGAGGGGSGGGGLLAILALTFTCGLALNIAVAVAVATEPSLRKALFLRCLATLAFANALDCALNVSIAGVAITSWMALSPRATSQLCRVSALTSQMTALAQTSAILAMVLERVSSVASVVAASAAPSTTSYVGVGGKEASMRAATVASSALIWFAWPSAVTLAAAPAVMAPVRIFPNRYGCGVAGPAGPAHWLAVSTLVIGYLIPWACMAFVLGSSARLVTRRRWRKQQLELAAQRRAANTAGAQGPGPGQVQVGQMPPPPALWFSPDDSGFGSSAYAQLSLAAVLLFLYATLLSPQILTTLTFQLVRVPLKRLPPPTPSLEWPANTGAYETVFVWMRFQFAVVSPGLVLIFHKEVRQRVERMLACLCRVCYCRCNKRLTPTIHVSKETCDKAADVRTPVLFATEQGLFLRVTGHMWGDTPDEASTSISGPFGSRTPWMDMEASPHYVFQFCDVALLDDKAASAAGQLRPLLGDVTPESQRRTMGSKPADWSRKNVRFASVVSEIPSSETCQVTDEPATALMPSSPPVRVPVPDSPVRWLSRNKRTTLELEIVSDDVNVISVRPAEQVARASATPTIDSSTFSLPPGKKLYPRTSHV